MVVSMRCELKPAGGAVDGCFFVDCGSFAFSPSSCDFIEQLIPAVTYFGQDRRVAQAAVVDV